ncbi:MAG: TonB-dependent receptor [Thermoanaerobaculia bacterium]|nr:TonB-dependent receptor [Thermoanaerobaculia bacterium]
MTKTTFRPLLALLLSWVPSVAFAQTTGELTGRVMDSTNVPIAGALVEVKSPALIRPRQTGTDKEGRYRFQLLPPGTYEVMARMTGFVDAIRTDIRIPLGETITVPMTLTVTATASVEVDTTPPLLDVENAKAGITVNQKVLQNLPLGRNYASAAALVPGTGTDALGPTFYGASSLENSYQIDGLNTTAVKRGGQGKSVPLEFAQEVEIRSGGYEAEYGKALGGNINLLTKSGGPQFTGNMFGYFTNESMSAADQHEADRLAVRAPAVELPRQYDVGLSLGGPLFRDRIWFFGAYDKARTDQDYRAVDHYTYSSTGVATPTYETRTDSASVNLFALNFSWMPDTAHNVSVSVFGDPSTEQARGWDPAVLPSGRAGPASATVTEKKTGGTDLSARWMGFLGKSIVEVQYGYHSENNKEWGDYVDRPVVEESRSGLVQFTPNSGPWTRGGYYGELIDETFRRNAWLGTWAFPLAGHDLKLGAAYELENPNRTAGWSGGEWIRNYYRTDGSYDYSRHVYNAKTPLNCTKLTSGETGNFGYIDHLQCMAWEKAEAVRSDVRTKTFSGFIQDSWRPLTNLTVKAGVRYDRQELMATDGAVAARFDDQWSPRLSVAWDPAGNGRTKVAASYGRYYQAFPQFAQISHLSGEFTVTAWNESPGVDPVASFDYAYLLKPIYMADDLKGSFQDEIAVGGELQAGRSLSIGIRGLYRGLGRAWEDRCDLLDPGQGLAGLTPPGYHDNCAMVNPGEGELGQLRDPANPDCFEDFPANTKPKPCESVRARRYYRGVELSVHYRPTKEAWAQASYVYSRLTGNFEGLVVHGASGGQQTDPGNSTTFDLPASLTDNFGRLPNDRTHQVKVSGSYTLPLGLTAGVIAQYWSGVPLSVYGAKPDFYFLWTAGFLAPRGSQGEMPSTYNIDLHLHYTTTIGNVTVTPALDIFNLTNVQRALTRFQAYNTVATNANNQPPFTNPTHPDFGKDVSWQRPRLIRLGLKAAF